MKDSPRPRHRFYIRYNDNTIGMDVIAHSVKVYDNYVIFTSDGLFYMAINNWNTIEDQGEA